MHLIDQMYQFPQKNSFQDKDKVSCAANYHNRMISEGSCDTEDWSIAEYSALFHNITDYSLFLIN